MNISILIGLIIAFGGLIAGYSMDGGNVNALFLLSPFIIVFGGTLGAVIASFGLIEVFGACKAFAASLLNKNKPDPKHLIEKLVSMSEECRREGILKLETIMQTDKDLTKPHYLLLKQGIVLALEMNTSDQIEEALEADMTAGILKKQMEIEVFEGASGFSPTLGIIGTVMGLVQVLSHMSDAEELTKAIAVAFIATLYGVVFANLIYMPIANSLKSALKREKIFKQMIIDGVCLLASGEQPRNISNKLAMYYQAFPKGEKIYRDGISKL